MDDRQGGMNLFTIAEPVIAQADEIELLAADYLRSAGGDVHLALRHAVADVLREAIDAQLAAIELKRAASLGYLRCPPEAVRGQERDRLSIIPQSGPRFAEEHDATSKGPEQAFVGQPVNACLEPQPQRRDRGENLSASQP